MRSTCLWAFSLIIAMAGCGSHRDPHPPTEAELTAMLKSEDPKLQIEAASWVEQLGPKAAQTSPALTAALKSPDA
jgi:hypothetical protein